MITFAILLIITLVIVIILGIAALMVGTGLVAIFGDLIVFSLIIWLLIKLFRRIRRGS